jgi:hypothetical protein
MQKQVMRKTKSRSRARKNSRKNKVQRGGVSNACVLESATRTSFLQNNGLANLHNINPQATLDLDNKFMAYGGPVPLGSNILQGGANSCGDIGVGTSNTKSETFKEYLEGVSTKLDSVVGGGNNTPTHNYNNEGFVDDENEPIPNIIKNNNYMLIPKPNQNNKGFVDDENEPIPNIIKNNNYMLIPKPNQNNKGFVDDENEPIPTPNQNNNNKKNNTNMYGGGYSSDPSEYIAGLPVYKGYDDCCPPALVSGQLKFGAPGQPSCGLGAIKGGSRKGLKKSKKQRKTSYGKQRSVKQSGGDWTTMTRSKPAMFDEAFNGPPGVFAYPDDMSKRAFNEKQPNYSPNAI